MRNHEIVADRAGGVLRFTLRNAWTPGALTAFQRAITAAVRSLPGDAGGHRIVLDLMQWPAQPAVLVDLVVDYLRSVEPVVDRVAIAYGPGGDPARFRRYAMPGRLKLFDSVERGCAWTTDARS